jgi:hypothetical protein
MGSDPAIASQKPQTNLLANQNRFKKMENESQRIQVDPRSIHYTKRNVPPRPYINSVQLPKEMSSILGYTLTGDLPGTNTFSKNGNN